MNAYISARLVLGVAALLFLPATSPVRVARQTSRGYGAHASAPDPQQLGFDTVRINELYRRAAAGEFPGVDGIVIQRHGVVVSEHYFNGYSPERQHDMRSATKSRWQRSAS